MITIKDKHSSGLLTLPTPNKFNTEEDNVKITVSSTLRQYKKELVLPVFSIFDDYLVLSYNEDEFLCVPDGEYVLELNGTKWICIIGNFIPSNKEFTPEKKEIKSFV